MTRFVIDRAIVSGFTTWLCQLATFSHLLGHLDERDRAIGAAVEVLEGGGRGALRPGA